MIKLFIPQNVEDTVNMRQRSILRLADLRETAMLWSEQLEKFCGLASSITSTTTELNREKNIMKTPKNIGKAMGKKFKN